MQASLDLVLMSANYSIKYEAYTGDPHTPFTQNLTSLPKITARSSKTIVFSNSGDTHREQRGLILVMASNVFSDAV